MSCYSSLVCEKNCSKSKNKEHNFDIALEVINANNLRVCCLNGCGTYFDLPLSIKQFKYLEKYWKKVGEEE